MLKTITRPFTQVVHLLLMGTTEQPLDLSTAPPPPQVHCFGGDNDTLVCLWPINRRRPCVPHVDTPINGKPSQIASDPQLIVPGEDGAKGTQLVVIPRPTDKELEDFEIAGFLRIPMRPNLSRPGLPAACKRVVRKAERQGRGMRANESSRRNGHKPQRIRVAKSPRQPSSHKVPALAG